MITRFPSADSSKRDLCLGGGGRVGAAKAVELPAGIAGTAPSNPREPRRVIDWNCNSRKRPPALLPTIGTNAPPPFLP